MCARTAEPLGPLINANLPDQQPGAQQLQRQRALGGGEDHALLATYPAGAAVPAPFRPIGVVRPAGDIALRLDGEPVTRPPGWDPYRDWDSARG